MSNNAFENELQERLQNHPSVVDTEATWLVVAANLKRKKRRRLLLLWWGLPGLLLVGLLVWFIQPATLPQAVLVETDTGSNIAYSQQSADDCPPVTNADFVPANNHKVMAAPLSAEAVTHQTTNSLVPEPPLLKPLAPQSSLAPPLTRPAAYAKEDSPNSLVSQLLPKQEFRLLADVASMPSPTQHNPEVQGLSKSKFSRAQTARFSFASEGSIGIPLRSILDGGSQGERNREFEKPLESFATQLLLGYHLPSGWSFRTGIGYTRINSKLEFTELNTRTTDSIAGIERIIINAPGDTTFVMGAIAGTETTRRFRRFYNYLNTIDIPLLIGYQFNTGPIDLRIEAGPVINVRSGGQATIIRAEEQFSTVDRTNYFRPKLNGPGWLAQVTTDFRITPNTSLRGGVRLQRFPNHGFELANIGTRTTYTLVGLSFGMETRF